MDFTDDAKIILYSNSLGTEKFYMPDTNKSNRYSALGQVVNLIVEGIRNGKIKFVSEEFKAKALSLFIEATEQKKYSPYYAKLRDLPVPKTPEEKEEFNKEVEKYKDLAQKRFMNGPPKASPVKEYPNLIKYQDEEKFVPREEYVNKALALLSKPKTQGLSIKNVRELETAIKQKKFDDESSKSIITALYADYDDNFIEEEVPVAQVVDHERGAILKSLMDNYGFTKAAIDKFKEVSTQDLRDILNDNKTKKNKAEVARLVNDNSEELGLTDTQVELYKTLSLKEVEDALEVHRKAAVERKKEILEKLKTEFNFSQDDLNALFQRDSLKELEEVLKDVEDQAMALATVNSQPQPSPESSAASSSNSEEEDEPQPESGLGLVEAPPVIEQPEPEDEVKRELLEEIRAANPDLSTETLDYLKTLSAQKIMRWKDFREKLIEAGLLVNAANDEADDNADDGFFGLRNNFINALGTEGFNIENLQDLQQLLDGQEKPVFQAALTTILSRPEVIYAFDQNFLNDAIQNQQAAGNLVEQANQEVQPGVEAAAADALGGDGNPDPNPPADPPAEAKPSVSGSQPIAGTGSDSEKLNYVKRVHPDVIEIFFGQSSFPDWDTELEKKLMSMEMSEARRIEIMEDVIAEYGTKIFIKARKGSSKEELNELVQLQFCVMRNLQRGPRAKTASVKVSDLVRMQSLAAGNGAPAVPQPAAPDAQPPVDPLVAQQAANIQAAPKPMITEARGEITNAQVQTFSEAKFISDYSRMQMSRNLNSGVKLEYPNPPPKIFNNQTPQTVNHPGRAAGLGRKRVTGFSSGKF